MIFLEAELTSFNYELWHLILRGIQAAGTICVALLAIFGSRIINFIFKPNLRFEIGEISPFIETIEERQDIYDSENKHIKISAKISNNGNTTSKNTQAIVEKVYTKRQQNETFYKYQEFIPIRFDWNNFEESSIVTPQIPSFITLARIEEEAVLTSNTELEIKEKKKSDYNLYLSIQDIRENGGYLKLGKGTFIIPIVLFCDNLRNTSKAYIEVYWNGDQINDLNQSIFYIKEISNSQFSKIIEE